MQRAGIKRSGFPFAGEPATLTTRTCPELLTGKMDRVAWSRRAAVSVNAGHGEDLKSTQAVQQRTRRLFVVGLFLA
jgi:hypothetical protein